MALVRVYFGLTPTEPSSQDTGRLAVAVVDDSGRLIDICEITDDAAGYAELGAMFAERAGGPAGVSLAVDNDEHRVTLLLAAAGRPIAVADEDLVDDYAERFADDDSPEERTAPPAPRRAVGLARALQAGALVAYAQAPPRELVNLKPVLAAHAAMAAGRQAAATALREVLREVYPAALRAYPDPADPVPLAILEKLPEPGLLAVGSANRGRESDVAAQVAATGLADPATIADAVTALRVAISETPRRTGIGRTVTGAVAETVRQAIGAVRACDNAVTALISVLDVPAPGHRPAAVPAAPETYRDQGRVPTPRRGRTPTPTMASATPLPPSLTPPVVTPRVATPPPPAVRPAAAGGPSIPRSTIPRRARTAPAAEASTSERPGFPPPGQAQTYGYSAEYATVPPPASAPPAAPVSTPPATEPEAPAAREAVPPAARQDAPPPARDAAPPVPESGSRAARRSAAARSGPATPGSGADWRPSAPPPGSRTDWPLSARTGDDAASTPDAGRWRDTPSTSDRPADSPAAGPTLPRRSAADRSETPTDPRVTAAGSPAYPAAERPAERDEDGRSTSERRVVPPWQSDDLPAEPAPLRLVEPAPIADRALRPGELRPTTPPLRLVDQNERAAADDLPTRGTREEPPGRRRRREEPTARGPEAPGPGATPPGPANGLPRPGAAAEAGGGRRAARAAASAEHASAAASSPVSSPPVAPDGDGDLLIFSETRSAWFTGQFAQIDWSNPADEGWRAAELAAEPQTTDETVAGLPKRVPKANLVPGSASSGAGSGERSLRIVRDPAAMAAHTTGYFRGSRRGEEVRGYAVGGRPGRDSASGWDFSRDGEEPSWESTSGGRYRSAVRR